MASTNITTFPGKVGISNANPTHTLSIGSNVFVDDTGLIVTGTITTTGELSGDGAGLSNIQTSNVIGLTNNVARIGTLETDLDSNVTRIETLETDLDSNATRIGTLETDLDSNVTRIETLETDLDSNATRIGTLETDLDSNVTRIETLETDLDSNVTRIGNLESGDITITGTKTFQDDVVLESNLRVQGDLLVANTVNMTVSDPILELGSNNLNTGDVGLVMTRHGASNSNVAIFFDETADTLKLGYTLNGAGDSTLEFDSNALAVSVQGALTASTGTFSGDVGIGTTAPGYTLDVDGDINFTGTFYQGGSPFVSSLWTDGQDSLYYRSNVEVGTANLFVDTTTSRVGINTITPGYDLDVDGDINFTGNFYQGGSPFVSSEWTTGSESLYYRSNVEIGTANLFVDTTTSRVGINTITPGYDLDVHGTSNVGALTATSVSGNGSGLTSLNATNISSGTINKDRLPGTLNNTTIGSLAIGANDVTLTAKANYHGLKILKAFDSPDEPATLLLSGDGDVFDDIAFEIRGNTSGSSVDTTTTRNSDDTTFGILHTGHTYIGYANLNPGEAGGNSQSGDPMLNVNGAGAFTGDFEVGTANLFVDVSTSNVGIGTTSPAYTLDVHGTSNVGALTATSVSGNGSGLTSLNASNLASGTVPSARLSLAASDIPDLSASKITSGTLTRPIDTTFITLNVGTRGDVYFEDNSNDNANGAGFTLRTSSNPTTGSIFAVRSSGQAGRLWVGQDLTSTGVNPFYAGYSGTNGGESNSSSYNFVVTTSGDVGIGTTSPGYTLDVHGTSNVGALTTTSVSGNGSGLTSLNASNLASGTVSSDRLSLAASDIPDLSASKITSGTLGRPISTSTGVFTSTGNVVLVGPNGGGQVGLTINDGDGNANITFNHASRVPDQNGSSGRIDCGVDGTTGYMRLRVKSSVTGGTSTGNLPECVRIEEGYVRAYSNFYVDDNVGIGTTNPGARLEVLGNSANQWGNILYLKNSAGSNRLSLKDEQTSPYIPPGLWTGAGGGLSIGSQYEGIMFYASASGATPVERMRITSGGNVGIGTNAPMKSLDVRNGDGEAAANWISGVFGSKTGLSSNPRVVVGTYSNVAIVGSHTGSLNAWNDLYLNNPSYPCVVKANGSVGIGTTSPIYKLDVRGDVYVDNSSVFMSGYTEGPTNNTVYSQYVGKRYSGRILAGMEIENVRTNSAGTAITTTGHYGQKLHFRAHDYGIYGGSVGDRTMSIVGNSVGIGTTSPSYKLHVSGDIYATGNVIAYSDVRKKKNLEIIEKPVEKVNKLNGYTYEMDDKRYTGLVAQEVLKVLPEAVVGDEENGYGLAYGNMVGLLVEALKEVNEQLQAEKAKVATVLARLDALENA